MSLAQVAGRHGVTGWRHITTPGNLATHVVFGTEVHNYEPFESVVGATSVRRWPQQFFLEGAVADESEECCGSRLALLSDASSSAFQLHDPPEQMVLWMLARPLHRAWDE